MLVRPSRDSGLGGGWKRWRVSLGGDVDVDDPDGLDMVAKSYDGGDSSVGDEDEDVSELALVSLVSIMRKYVR